MGDSPIKVSRARYYDAMLAALDREVKVELTSDRAKFLYGAARRILARFATANEDVEPLPENPARLERGILPSKMDLNKLFDINTLYL